MDTNKKTRLCLECGMRECNLGLSMGLKWPFDGRFSVSKWITVRDKVCKKTTIILALVSTTAKCGKIIKGYHGHFQTSGMHTHTHAHKDLPQAAMAHKDGQFLVGSDCNSSLLCTAQKRKDSLAVYLLARGEEIRKEGWWAGGMSVETAHSFIIWLMKMWQGRRYWGERENRRERKASGKKGWMNRKEIREVDNIGRKQ